MNDPRVGSSRDNNTTPSLTHLASGTNSSSLSALWITLLPTSIYAAICILIFLATRHRLPQVYSPRAYLSSLRPHERSPELSRGWFKWFKEFYHIPDTYVLNHSSLDGFLFLRFLKILTAIYVVGCLILWPILLPVHATGGGGLQQLDRISFGNVADPRAYWAHAVLAWIFFGFVLYMISRECIYYINLRQAYLLSPFYANRLSSRTVLFTCIPRQYLSEMKLRSIFGRTVKTIWIPRKSKELNNLVKERRQTALRLEKAEIALIKMTNLARNKILKSRPAQAQESPASTVNGESKKVDEISISPTLSRIDSAHDLRSPEKPHFESEIGIPLPDVNGSVASQWISHSSRPHHRPLANKLRRVDTIKWTRRRMKELSRMINRLRRKTVTSQENLMPSAFIEFKTQADAQAAHQTLAHHRPLHMSPRFIGVRPFEIVWEALEMKWWEQIIRRFSIQAFIAAMIIFWSIPCAIVGTLSNVDYLAEKVKFLSFILNLPKPVLGLITGLLPAVALSVLMSIVPGMIRSLARIAGVPSLALIELFTQNAYFGFQVVQVFLITTLTSAASAALVKIIADPTSAESLLSKNLPTASNFYISYFLIQSLGVGAGALLDISRLVRLQVLGRFTQNPRLLWSRLHRLRRAHWGGIFPVFTNMGVIALSYACIAPVILGFAAVGTFFLYGVYRYNVLYVWDSEISTMGLVYPRALMQLMTGLYFAEVCLFGLFVIRLSFGPMALLLLLIIFTALVHMSLLDAVGPLLTNLPRTLAVETQPQDLSEDLTPDQDMMAYHDFGPEDEPVVLDEGSTRLDDGEQSRAIEGAGNVADAAGDFVKETLGKKLKEKFDFSIFDGPLDLLNWWISPDPNIKPNMLLKWLHPEIYSDYPVLRQLIPPELPNPSYPPEIERYAYYQPSMMEKPPCIWIPRDPAGVSQQEVAHTGKVTEITDEGARLNEKNGLVVDLQSIEHIDHHQHLRW